MGIDKEGQVFFLLVQACVEACSNALQCQGLQCTLTAPLGLGQLFMSQNQNIHTKLTTEIGAFILDIVMLWILNILSH